MTVLPRIQNIMQRRWLKIVAATEGLNKFPKIGRIVPEIGDTNVRELFVYSYRLIYEISTDCIEILAIIYGKRDFFDILIKSSSE